MNNHDFIKNQKPGSAGAPPANNTVSQTSPHSSFRRGWHSRGYVPHFDAGEIPQFITFRLADSLPAEVLRNLHSSSDFLTSDEAKAEQRRSIEEYLDKSTGNSWLKNPALADIVEDTLLHFDGKSYRLHSWVVMPNHVHVLLTPVKGHGISEIMHSLKSFTAKMINRELGAQGRLWQADYYDRFIRNEAHFIRTIEYIEMNPVNAGLCSSKNEWRFSSAKM
jgi:putative DNA methylase